MKTGPLFNKLLECKKKIIILQGGGDAAKTITALQYLAQEAIMNPRSLVTVTGQDVPNIKGGALNSFQKYVVDDVQKYITKFNETERIYTLYNKSRVEFKSFQDEQDARGSEREYLFMNEANAETYNLFWQLQRKTRRKVIIDYNPTAPFWAHEKLIDPDTRDKQFEGKVQFYRVWHQHNPFLSQEEHEAYENITDPQLFRVFSRGLTGALSGLIFGHFREWREAWPDDAVRTVWGLDYGYTSDPTALVKVAVGGAGKPLRRVGKECTYEPGLSDESIRNILLANGWRQDQIIYSEADPNMINQLRILGLPIIPAIKGPGSVPAGISKVRQHECYYTQDSKNFKKEIGMYQFLKAQDIITGKEVTTNVPVKGWDHCCDAFRYADYTDSLRHR